MEVAVYHFRESRSKQQAGKRTRYLLPLSAAILLAATVTASAGQKVLETVEEGNFYVGGPHNAAGRMVGQMYVEYQIPPNRKKTPIVLIHGGGQIGAGWNQ